jgi:hypothetical protein
MRQYTKPAVTKFPLALIQLRLQGTGEPLIGTNCTTCETILTSICQQTFDDYFLDLVLENTTCAAAAIDVSSCTITVGSNIFTNCGLLTSEDLSCTPGSQDCRLEIQCLNTTEPCDSSDNGATVEINCPGFEVCSTDLIVAD